MFQMLVTPPFSYILSLFIGFIIGAGAQLIYGGLLLSSFIINKKSNNRLFIFGGIISFLLGVLFIIIGIIFFIRLIIDVYVIKAQSLSLDASVLLVLVSSFAMMIPFFTKRFKKHNLRS